jgi:hypothetical protein
MILVVVCRDCHNCNSSHRRPGSRVVRIENNVERSICRGLVGFAYRGKTLVTGDRRRDRILSLDRIHNNPLDAAMGFSTSVRRWK